LFRIPPERHFIRTELSPLLVCLRQGKRGQQGPERSPAAGGKNKRFAAFARDFSERDGMELWKTLRVPARFFERLGPMGKASVEQFRATAFPKVQIE
jgi:hypothetical protein